MRMSGMEGAANRSQILDYYHSSRRLRAPGMPKRRNSHQPSNISGLKAGLFNDTVIQRIGGYEI